MLLFIGVVFFVRLAVHAGDIETNQCMQSAIIPMSSDACKVFESGGMGMLRGHVLIMNKTYTVLTPPEVRWRKVDVYKFVRQTAIFNNLKLAWYGNKSIAILYRGVSDTFFESVVAGLESKDIKARVLSAHRAGYIPDVRIIKPLMMSALSSNVNISDPAFKSIVRLGLDVFVAVEGKACMPIVRKALSCCDGYPGHVKTINALGLLDFNTAFPLFKKVLKCNGVYDRRYAIKMLGSYRNKKSFTFIKKYLRDADRQVRQNAFKAMIMSNPGMAVPVILEFLQRQGRRGPIGDIVPALEGLSDEYVKIFSNDLFSALIGIFNNTIVRILVE